jgi:hypothetical protein
MDSTSQTIPSEAASQYSRATEVAEEALEEIIEVRYHEAWQRILPSDHSDSGKDSGQKSRNWA